METKEIEMILKKFHKDEKKPPVITYIIPDTDIVIDVNIIEN